MSRPEFPPALLSASSEDELREMLYRMKATDGLPVVLPTPERVDEMVQAAAMAGFERDLVVGEVGPNLGEATVERIAVNAVMAGCRPEHLPVVIAAVMALCDPTIDTSEFQVTTHPAAPLLIVNGPAVKEAGVACGFGALGYGHRSNLCIGRAVRLCLINLGGVWPGDSDMAIHGQPGSIALCLGEDEEASPFAPLHTTLGFDPSASVVTVACVGAPVSCICQVGGDGRIAERLLSVLADAIAAIGNNNALSARGTVVVVLNPDHARLLKREGYDRAEVTAALLARSGNPAGRVHGDGAADPEAWAPAIGGPDKLLILVAGGPGVYSTVMTPWGGGAHGNAHVSREIVFYETCEI